MKQFVHDLIAVLVLGLLMVNGWGCAAGIPIDDQVEIVAPDTGPARTVSIHGFSPEQEDVIREGLWAWCDAVGFCPTTVESDGVYQISLVHDYASYGRPAASAAFTQGAHIVRVDGDREAVMEDLGVFAVVMWHELGHFGIQEHLSTGIMAATIVADDLPPLEVDAAAARAFQL